MSPDMTNALLIPKKKKQRRNDFGYFPKRDSFFGQIAPNLPKQLTKEVQNMVEYHKLNTFKGDKHEMSAQAHYLYSFWLVCKQ